MIFDTPTSASPSHHLFESELQRMRLLFEERVTRMISDLTPILQIQLTNNPILQQLGADTSSAVFMKDHIVEVVQRELRSQLELHNQHLMRSYTNKTCELEHQLSELRAKLVEVQNENKSLNQSRFHTTSNFGSPGPKGRDPSDSNHIQSLILIERMLNDFSSTQTSILERLPAIVEASYDVCGLSLDSNIPFMAPANRHGYEGMKSRIANRKSQVLQEIAELHRSFKYMRRLAKEKEKESHDLQRSLQSMMETSTLRDQERISSVLQENESLIQRLENMEDLYTQLQEQHEIAKSSLLYVAQTFGVQRNGGGDDLNTIKGLGRAALSAVSSFQSRRAAARRLLNLTVERTLSCVRIVRAPLHDIRNDVISMQHSVLSAISQCSRLVQQTAHRSAILQRNVEAVLETVGYIIDIPCGLRVELLAGTAEVSMAALETFIQIVNGAKSKIIAVQEDLDRLRFEFKRERDLYESQLQDFVELRKKENEVRGALEIENSTLAARVQGLSRRLEEMERTMSALQEKCVTKEAENTKLMGLVTQSRQVTHSNSTSGSHHI